MRRSSMGVSIQRLLARAGVAAIRAETLNRLVSSEVELKRLERYMQFLRRVQVEYLPEAIALLPYSHSEFFQDIFCALLKVRSKSGFFVEFGATDGVSGSNTWMFEKKFGWQGVLAEPAKVWHKRLAENRACYICQDCVWSESGAYINFLETDDGGLSTIKSLVDSDHHSARRGAGRSYPVKTITLADMLDQAAAPSRIDLLTVDTEGSEYAILDAFPFPRWQIDVVCVEHNHRSDREDIQSLMARNGYFRVLSSLSGVDDWFVSKDVLDETNRTFIAPIE